MKRSVIVNSPIPSLEEFRKSLGLSKTRQKSLERIVLGETAKIARSKPRRSVSVTPKSVAAKRIMN